jgi:hypothetical protein
MPHDESAFREKELALRERELDLRAAELALQQEEWEAKKPSPGGWFSSPLAPAIWGLVATAVGIFLTSVANGRLEARKLQSSLIEKALSAEDKTQAGKNLRFYFEAGLLAEPPDKIVGLLSDPQTAPSFAGAALRDQLISVEQTKAVLKGLNLYEGETSDSDDPLFRQALAKFQLKQGLCPDGLLGPATLRELWWAMGELGPRPVEPRAETDCRRK